MKFKKGFVSITIILFTLSMVLAFSFFPSVVIEDNIVKADNTFFVSDYELQASGDYFTLIQLPDTQSWADGDALIANFQNTADWIIDNTESWHIFMTVHVGDIVDRDEIPVEWTRANVMFNELDNHSMPYLAIPGNHDGSYDTCPVFNLTPYHVYFPTSRFEDSINNANVTCSGTNYQWGGENGSVPCDNLGFNYYALLDIESGGYTYPFIVIGLRWCPSNSALVWLNETLDTYSDKNTIIFTHAAMNIDDAWLESGDSGACNGFGRALCTGDPDYWNCNDGIEQWNEVFKYHPNICLVLSGHIPYDGGGFGATGKATYDIPVAYQNASFDNKVHALLANYQENYYGGGYYSGAFRQYKFYLEDGYINATTYSTDTTESESDNGWYNGSENKFTLIYNFTYEEEEEIQFISIDGGTNGTTIYNSIPTINWTDVSNTANYWLQVDNNANFASPEINITNINQYNYPLNCVIDTNVSFIIPVANKLTSYDTYYMRVRSFTR